MDYSDPMPVAAAEVMLRLGATDLDAATRLCDELPLNRDDATAAVAAAHVLLEHGTRLTRPTPEM
jgi:hypothetical protein